MVSDEKKPWESPKIVMEQELVARAQDGLEDEGDAFLGPLSVPGQT
ncbi:MAG: hypothetical protein KDD73_09365 [Anaerolineales bacterium]|nr:hypothetical protein [Anaerolineales bacterium]MCB9126541.1 hypothetical protein [Ardenticatenales bacterium]